MSKNFLVIGYPVPEGGFDAESAKRALATVADSDLYDALDYLDWQLAGQLEEEGEERDAARRVAERRLGDCIDVLADDERSDADILTYTVPPGTTCLRVWVTGGLSSGDDPTEAFGPAHVVDQLPDAVLDALLRRGAAPR